MNSVIQQQAYQIAISDIDVDYEWNSRSPADVQSLHSSEADNESRGLEGLKEDILLNGQTTPVEVRSTGTYQNGNGEVKFYKDTNKPYSLISGFRRVTALQSLYDDKKLESEALSQQRSIVKGVSNGHVIAKIYEPMSELNAYKLNAKENVHHEPLSATDRVLQVKKGLEVLKLGINDLAIMLNKSPVSIARYVRISKLPMSILSHWQRGGSDFEGVKSTVKVSLEEMDELSKTPEETWLDGYRGLLLNAGKLKVSAGTTPSNQNWFEKSKYRAQHMGTMLAKLYENGFVLGPTIPPIMWRDNIATLIRSGNTAISPPDIRALAEAAEASFKRMLGDPSKQDD
jgi:hypothetical protein